MTPPDWLWAVFTLIAATAQTFRNATQRSLTERLGTVGATHIRFFYGLPFGLLALAVVAPAFGSIPVPNLASLLWTATGAAAQVAATALMLAAMRERSFVVATAYTKTEPMQITLFAMVFLGEVVTLPIIVAVLIATAGMLILSWPSRAGSEIFSWRPAILGILSGGLFAIAAVGIRGGILALDAEAFVPAASLMVAISLAMQSVLLSAWLLVRNPAVLKAVLREWRPSLMAGFFGAFASEMWFLAYAIQTPAKVRTLGLVEILIAGAVSRRLFAQAPGLRDIMGIALVVAGVVLLFNG